MLTPMPPDDSILLANLVERHGVDRILAALSQICGDQIEATAGHDIRAGLRWLHAEEAVRVARAHYSVNG
jgi:hypothetical protein